MNKTQSIENDSLQIPCTYSVEAPLKILFCYDRKLNSRFLLSPQCLQILSMSVNILF